MASWDEVRHIALALPETTERESRGNLQWCVAGRLFVWERPLRKGDLAALGSDAPAGPILGARVADEGVKFALAADQPEVYFTIPHFDGYAAVLVRLDVISEDELTELTTEAWLLRAPKKLAREFLGS
jgi:hypothetical protein